jgi:hypothetical protein
MKVELKAEEVWALCKVCTYSQIMLCMEDEPHVSIMGSQNPREAWEKLERTYGSQLANSQTMLISELVQMRYNGSGILEYKVRMDTLRLHLIEVG